MTYIYDGPVSDGNKEITRHWHGETIAPSLAKAQGNLKYQFNKQANRLPYCTVQFDINKIKAN